MRGINWPAGLDACASKCSVRVLICVWSQMSCCKWLKLSLEFNFTVRHTSGHTESATRSYDVTMILSTHAIIIDAFVNNFNCSKHDVTMASGSQATVRTCNDYSDSKVRSFSSKVRATWYSIVTDCNYESSCWAHYWASNELGPTYVRARFQWNNQKKMLKLAEYSAVPVAFIYSCRHYGHHKQERMITFQFS